MYVFQRIYWVYASNSIMHQLCCIIYELPKAVVNDWAILKYEVNNANNDALSSIPKHSPDDYGPDGKYTVITYETNTMKPQNYH